MKKILFRGAVLALVLALAVFIVALADNVQNDIQVNVTDTFTAPGSTIVGYRINATANDSTDNPPRETCNASDGTNAIITVNAPSDVTVTGSPLSFASCGTYQFVTLSSSEPGDYEITVSVVDTGAIPDDYNTNSAKFTLHVLEPEEQDETPPTINCTVPDQTIWYGENVTVACTASDSESGLVNSGDASFSLTTDVDEGEETVSAETDSRVVCDVAGNCATVGPYIFKVDKKAPTIVCDTPAPTFLLNEADASVTATATDGGSGPGSQNVSAAADTSSVLGNPQSVDVSAEDNLGNSSSLSCPYSVIYDWDGFFQPVDNLPTLNKVKAGSAIPVKFSLAGDQGLDIFASGSPYSVKIVCDTSELVDTIEQTVTAGNSSLSYDPVADQYVYVWKTDKTWAGTCRLLSVTLIDGTTQTAKFTFTK